MTDAPTRFGAFIAPFHDPRGNPTLQMRRDVELSLDQSPAAFDALLPELKAAISAGSAILNICTSSASSAQPPKQDQNVFRSGGVISRYQ